MLKAVTIGSLIVCHLFTGKQTDTAEGPKEVIKKVLGEIIDIKQKKLYYEDVKNKEVKAYDENFLYVKDIVTKEILEINSTACMIVRPETDSEAKERKYGKPVIQKVETSYDEKGNIISEKNIDEKDFIKDVVLPDVKTEIENKKIKIEDSKINSKEKSIPAELVEPAAEKKESVDDLDMLEKQIQNEAKSKK